MQENSWNRNCNLPAAALTQMPMKETRNYERIINILKLKWLFSFPAPPPQDQRPEEQEPNNSTLPPHLQQLNNSHDPPFN